MNFSKNCPGRYLKVMEEWRSLMDCNQKALSENKIIDFVNVDEPTTLRRPFSDEVRDLNESGDGKDMDEGATNTVDEVSTIGPNLAEKSKSKSRKKKKNKKREEKQKEKEKEKEKKKNKRKSNKK